MRLKNKRKVATNLKTISLLKLIQKIKKIILKHKPNTLGAAIRIALKIAKTVKKINKPRVIEVPKTGGILPLIPIFAGLSALGALTGGVAGVTKALSDAKSAKEQLLESQRHNKTMESIAMGRGLYLKTYKTGLGLFL